tara:strand:+ start:224 stop:577 length:354 start_codon:yes stop_codon:yes gene_type:complete
MVLFPKKIWSIIKNFQINYKNHHEIKMKIILENDINNRFVEEYTRWTYFPPWPNTNDIIRDEYLHRPWHIYSPTPNLKLTSITWNPNGNENGGWYSGYGWKKTEKINGKHCLYYKYN